MRGFQLWVALPAALESAPAFSRFFRAATGKTFVGFVNLLRVDQACRLLGSTTQSVTAIAAGAFDRLSGWQQPRKQRLAQSSIERSVNGWRQA